MLPRILTHAIDEEADLYLMEDVVANAIFDATWMRSKREQPDHHMNLAEIALQTPPPGGLNPLHIFAIHSKTKVLGKVYHMRCTSDTFAALWLIMSWENVCRCLRKLNNYSIPRRPTRIVM